MKGGWHRRKAMTGGFRRKCGGHRGRTQRSAPTRAIVTWCRGGPPCPPVDNGCTPVVPLIRHGCAVVGSFAALRMRRTPCGCFAMPPSPLRGEGYDRSDGSIQMPKAFPSSVTGCASATFPQGKAFQIHPAILKSDSTPRIKTTPFPPENPAIFTRNLRKSKPQINLWKSRWKV